MPSLGVAGSIPAHSLQDALTILLVFSTLRNSSAPVFTEGSSEGDMATDFASEVERDESKAAESTRAERRSTVRERTVFTIRFYGLKTLSWLLRLL